MWKAGKIPGARQLAPGGKVYLVESGHTIIPTDLARDLFIYCRASGKAEWVVQLAEAIRAATPAEHLGTAAELAADIAKIKASGTADRMRRRTTSSGQPI
jgi:hypothetical protein